jgi:hypothetical protein
MLINTPVQHYGPEIAATQINSVATAPLTLHLVRSADETPQVLERRTNYGLRWRRGCGIYTRGLEGRETGNPEIYGLLRGGRTC